MLHISHSLRHVLQTLATVALLAAGVALEAHAEVIRVSGKVVSEGKNTPMMSVNIVNVKDGRLLAQSDEDGRFAIDVADDATLRFSLVGAKAQVVKVKGRTYIEVTMEEETVDLSEATVTAKRITDKILPEPTDIEVRGNYFHIKTRVRVPREMFSHDTRLVVQPVLHDVTSGEQKLMRPLVFDARQYNITQQRMYDFCLDEGDPLAPYITVKSDSTREAQRKNDILGYRDSIYVENVKHDFSCDVFMAIENYYRILYRDTTIIAKGTVNPLRFLDYRFGAHEITEEAFFPKAELQLRDSKGEINLVFPIGKSTIDPDNETNRAELDKLNRQLQDIAGNKDASLQAFSIHGTASPDGRYDRNLELAERRMNTALSLILGKLDEETRRNLKVSHKAEVASWAQVARLLRADSLTAEADQVENITQRFKNMADRWRRIKQLPCYPLIQQQYLPRLRRVEYEMSYSIYRFLTIEEIRALHQKDYRQLTRYEFFRLYREQANPAKREQILRQALEIYPSFMVAAADLQALLVARDAPDPELLEPFAGKDAPATLNVNHIVALLSVGHYAKADSIAEFVPQTDDTKLLKAVTAALNGRYEENFETVAATSERNRTVMLLALKRNDEALKVAKTLPEEEAVTHYLRAICMNRNDEPFGAYEELKKAFEIDPSLEKVAQVDGDVNDLLPQDKNNTAQ